MRVAYTDEEGRASRRVVWPLTLLFYSHLALLWTWCETRQDYRFFRSGRINGLQLIGRRFNPRKGRLLAEALARVGQKPDRADAPSWPVASSR